MTTQEASRIHKNLLAPGMCAGCGGRIEERYYLQAVEKEWHVHCLTCSDCHVHLDTQLTCFARDGGIYCKDDYYRRFAHKRCSRCQQAISSKELVMRAREQVFHLSCFACAACNRTLLPGDEFALHDHLLFCRTDFQLLFQGHWVASLDPGDSGIPGHSPNQDGGVPFRHGAWRGVPKGKSRRRRSSLRSEDGCSSLGLDTHITDGPGDLLDQGDGYGAHSNIGRQKRVRTSFKHQQLRTMKSYFSLNHNPDAKDLRQLAQKTGLSKRVLQVWFQNARAKYRRSLMKLQADPPDPNKLTSAGATTPETSPSATGDNYFSDGQKEGSAVTDFFSNSRSPAALSDISSTASVSGSGDVVLTSVQVDYNCGSQHGSGHSGECVPLVGAVLLLPLLPSTDQN